MIPAKLTGAQVRKLQDSAVRVFKAVECSGMARVDFFLEKSTGKVFLNEINTIPGFTSISMYPKMWEASGVPFRELVDRLLSWRSRSTAKRPARNTRSSFRPARAARSRSDPAAPRFSAASLR